MDERKPWDQLEGEPPEAYARFLAYRNLGPARSLDAAYRAHTGATKSNKRQSVPGNWGEESSLYRWPERATAWDIDNLQQAGQAIVAKYVALVDGVATRALEALANEKIKPRTYGAVMGALDVLNGIVTAEAVTAAQRNSGDIPPIGGGHAGVTVNVNGGSGSEQRAD